MTESEYIGQVIKNAVQVGASPQTHFQQIVAHHMIGELDGTTPGAVAEVVREEIRRRLTTPRYTVPTAIAR